MHEMTLPEVLNDPLIRQLRRADKVSMHAFTTLLREAAARGERQAELKPAAARRHASSGTSPKFNSAMEEAAG
jgi:hypothetical protein